LKYVEEENAKLRNRNRELRNELASCEEENHELEKTINSLKEQLEDYEKLKAELDHTNKELMLTMEKLEKFGRSTEKLDEILCNQRSPTDKTGLGYDNSSEMENTDKEDNKDEGNSRSYANSLRSGINNQEEFEEQQEHNTFSWNKRSEFRRHETPRRSLPIRYENIFLGHCYTCRNFGHKEIHCKINARNNYVRNINDYGYPRNNHVNNRFGNAYGYVNRNYNPFDPLMDQNIICYKCNNIGHKA
jgi:hypothetical protein